MITLALFLLQQPAAGALPGPYWQQEVGYEIEARLDEPSGVLSGAERIRYTNRSPDTLTSFSLHLYLNAFRPGSRWSDADSVEGRRRFNDLGDPDFAFNHVRDVRIMGAVVQPVFPFAPDSTIVRFALPQPLPPGESMSVDMGWDARPSTVPRRQGRAGRRFDFAQWYPKVVVYDRYGWNERPLYPAGEFYGEFGSFLVDLDVPADQVIGATGVPVCGDPGWERANRVPSRPVDYQRDYYGARTPSKDGCQGAAPGRKKIRWYAEDVHHFAMSLNPEYRYEGGRYEDVGIHVLYQPGDESTWGNGVAVKRTATALAWLGRLFGPFAWPQLTNLHRIEGGGTEFPMMVMDGSADQGLIVHEVGHNYTMGILANNEWREGWLDEGFTAFQTTWFWETMGQPGGYERVEASILDLDLDGYSEPVSLRAEAYRDFVSYNLSIYSRGELFFQQLRYIVGDETMQRILQTYYQRWKLKHVDEAAFRAVAEEVSQRDLSSFFGQGLHATELYDYTVGKVRVAGPQGGGAVGQWRTRVEVVRKEDGRMPVEVVVEAERDTAVVRAEGLAEREWVELETRSKPKRVVLDPRVRSRDWNMLNNQRRVGGFLAGIFARSATGKAEHYFHPYFSTRSRRDRITYGYHPTVWYNDAGGLTLGLRSRTDYLGRFEQNVSQLNISTGWDTDLNVEDTDFYFRIKNPVGLRAPNASQALEVFNTEGRYGATASLDWVRREHLTFGPTWHRGIKLAWLATDDFRYLDPGYYDDAGIVELQLTSGVATQQDEVQALVRSSLAAGLAYNRNGLDASGRPNLNPFYLRGVIEATVHRKLRGADAAARLFLGVASGDNAAAKQRQIYVQGSDPWQQLNNPFLRSRGALLVGDDFRYHAPGGANLRAVDPRVSTTALLGFNFELDRAVVSRSSARLFNRIGVAVFTDLAYGIGGEDQPLTGGPIRFLADVGLGIRANHRIGDTRFTTRFDFPFYLNKPELAQHRAAGDDNFEFRWTFSFQPTF